MEVSFQTGIRCGIRMIRIKEASIRENPHANEFILF